VGFKEKIKSKILHTAKSFNAQLWDLKKGTNINVNTGEMVLTPNCGI
jgi:hypothetical protein